jgi:hypothetical protein
MGLPAARLEAFFAEGEKRWPGLVDGEALHKTTPPRLEPRRYGKRKAWRGERSVGA